MLRMKPLYHRPDMRGPHNVLFARMRQRSMKLCLETYADPFRKLLDP